MENVAVRSRYPRHAMTAKRKRKSVRETGSYRDKLVKQVMISVLVLMIVGIVKNANTSVTNYLCDKLSEILSQNIETQSVYDQMEGFINKVLKKDDTTPVKEDGNTGKNLPENGSGSNTDEKGTGGMPEEQSQNTLSTPAPSPKPTSTPQALAKSDTSSQAVSPAAVTVKSPFITPAEGALGSPFGERIDPYTKSTKMHKGIDIEAGQGASIKAAAAGEVMDAAYEKTLGNYIKIQHDASTSTVYAHCSQLIAKKGQKVKQGDIIAKVGSTGQSTGAHLHFEIWKDGKAVNPLGYIKVPEK